MDLSEDDSDLPTASEALLLLTLPASAAPLSSALMPRRHRERILEITKTVTVTEVVNNSPRCHPGTCEVTVTNVDSGSGHPVSVNISHLHEKRCEDRCSGASSPVVHVKEFVKEESRSGTIEKITSTTERILKVETGGDVTFGERGDNVIDLNFTYPLSKNDIRVVNEPNKTLFYHSYEKETSDVANDLLSPDSAVSDSPKRYMRSDDSDSDSGSLVIHSPVGRADSGVSSTAHHLNGKNLSISVGSSEEDDLRYSEPLRSPQPGSVTGQRLPVYIVTGKAETPNSERSRSTATLFADIEASVNTSSMSAGPSVTTVAEENTEIKSPSMTSLEREEERKRILVVTNVASTLAEEIVESAEEEAAYVAGSSGEWSDSLPGRRGRSRLTMEVLFTPPTPLEKNAPPKPPRRAKYGPIQLVEHVQHYECPMDELSEGPIMTSTPMNTLERPPRKSAEERKRLRESPTATEESSPDETPILTPSRKSSKAKPPALEPVTPENSLDQPVPSPRRSPSSPIVVVDQERKSSMDLLVPPKQPRRKSTVTDIDWFAAFNMKEPTTPKSPRSPLPIDALREAENMVIERKRPAQPVKPLTPSNIDLDDVFACTSQSQKEDKNCTCNACALMKMSEEELRMRVAAARRSPTPVHHQVVENVPLPEPQRRNIYEDSDISMDDIFSAPTTKKVEATTSQLQKPVEDTTVHRLYVDPPRQTAEVEIPAELLESSDAKETPVHRLHEDPLRLTAETGIPAELLKSSEAPDVVDFSDAPVHRLYVDPPRLTAEIEIPAELLESPDARKHSVEKRTATIVSSSAFPTNAEGLSLASQFISSSSALPQEPLADEGKDQATQTEHKVLRTTTTTTETVERVNTKWLEQLLSEPVNEEELKETVQQLHDVVVAENAEIIELTSENELNHKKEEHVPEKPTVVPTQEEVVETIVESEHEKALELNTSVDIGYESQDVSGAEKEIEKNVPLLDSIVDLDEIFRPIQEKSEKRKKPADETVTQKDVLETEAEIKTDTSKTVVKAEISYDYIIESTKYEPILVSGPRDLDEEAKSPAKLKTFDFENIKEVFEDSEGYSVSFDSKEEKKVSTEEHLQQESVPSTSDVSWLTDIVSSSKEEGHAPEIALDSICPKAEALTETIEATEILEPSASVSLEECLPSTSAEPELHEEQPHNVSAPVLPLEQSKPVATFFSLDWIESMIEESQKVEGDASHKQEERAEVHQDTPRVDDILRLVFETPCESLDRGKTCPCSACALSKLSSEELQRFWRKVQERQSEVVITSTLEVESQTTTQSVGVLDNVKASTIDLEDVFGAKKAKTRVEESTETTTHRVEVLETLKSEPIDFQAIFETKPKQAPESENETFGLDSRVSEQRYEVVESAHPLSTSEASSVIPMSTTLDSSADDHSETTADSWILSVLKNEAEAPSEQFQFEDSFELSYLASIREEEKQTRDQVTTYTNYYREEITTPTTPKFEKSAARRHVDDYYDEPEEEEFSLSGNINVEDLVDDILNSSLNEAALVAATRNFKREESRHTDTSYDRKPVKNPQSMYLATAGSESLMESILPLATPPAAETHQQSFEMNSEKFVSEASVVLSESPPDDYIIRLVFANSDSGAKEEPVESVVITESEIASPASDEIREVTVVERTSESYYTEKKVLTTQRTMSRSDEEILEVEVNPEHYLIKGSYSVVINKTDPLGVLLSELQADTTALDFALTPKLRRLLMQCLREKARPNEGKTLSSRARHLVTRTDPAYDVFYQMQCNRYSAENPTGNINFCTAENNICKDLIEERFRKDPVVFQANSDHVTHYGPPGGYPEVKSALSKYLKDEYNADVDDGNILLLPSGNATYDLVCHCSFDSDDVVLTNAPTYSRNFINVSERAQCTLKTVPINLDDPKISVADFEKCFQEYSEQGDNVRAVVLINPHNPLGIVFPIEDIKKLAAWTAERNLWLIVDESFAQCVHDDNTSFTSFVEYQMALPTKSVWFWGLSKDFGLPGVKLSMAQTNDRDLYKALCQIELTEPVSSLAQDFVVNFLSDREWLNRFKAEKKKRLRAHYEFAIENLKQLSVPFIEASSGIFVFVDFRKKLSTQSEAGEEELWRALTAKGIFMTPGMHTKSPQPGWMRLVFACDKEQVREGFRRLHEFFDSKRNVRELSY